MKAASVTIGTEHTQWEELREQLQLCADEVVVRIETLVEASVSLSRPISDMIGHATAKARPARARTSSTASVDAMDDPLPPTTGMVSRTCVYCMTSASST